jgi:site-specific DNA-methyltransferase (adenine-specific)
MSNIEACLSSKTDSWETPQDFFNKLNNEFNFTLDPSSTHENHKCNKYYTIEDDGLLKDWSKDIVFCNPPYGKTINKWVKKSYEESLKGATVVLLIPSRTETNYWHDYIFPYAKEIRYIRGRLKFVKNGKTPEASGRAPFPSAVVIFNSKQPSK